MKARVAGEATHTRHAGRGAVRGDAAHGGARAAVGGVVLKVEARARAEGGARRARAGAAASRTHRARSTHRGARSAVREVGVQVELAPVRRRRVAVAEAVAARVPARAAEARRGCVSNGARRARSPAARRAGVAEAGPSTRVVSRVAGDAADAATAARGAVHGRGAHGARRPAAGGARGDVGLASVDEHNRSQSAKPASHACTAQTPSTQADVPFAMEHAVPQPPQAATVAMFTSQPLLARPSQFAKTRGATEHARAPHARRRRVARRAHVAALAAVLQAGLGVDALSTAGGEARAARRHADARGADLTARARDATAAAVRGRIAAEIDLAAVDRPEMAVCEARVARTEYAGIHGTGRRRVGSCTRVAAGSAVARRCGRVDLAAVRVLALQSPRPGGHTMVHTPAVHAGVAPGAPHATPQPPQLETSRWTSTQAPAHATRPSGHSSAQAPVTHAIPTEHATPHAPQWRRSSCVSVRARRMWPSGQRSTSGASRSEASIPDASMAGASMPACRRRGRARRCRGPASRRRCARRPSRRRRPRRPGAQRRSTLRRIRARRGM